MKIIRLFSFLNMDVALGACTISFLISKYFEVKLPFFAYLLLFMAVMAIYIADHLLDDFKIKHTNISERRQFYRTNNGYLYFALFNMVWGGFLISLVYLPNFIFARAYIIVGFVAFYVIFDYFLTSKPIPKELIIAILYVAGVGFYPIMLQNYVDCDGIILLIAILLIAIENLLIYSVIDFQDDINCGLTSIANTCGIRFTNTSIICTFFINFALIILLQIFSSEKWMYHVVLAIIHCTQIFVYYNREKLQRKGLYRWIADGIFLLPLALLLID
ncbi:MAG: hypothetical protein ACKVOU_06855 [Cytophagales bacterium]